MLIVVAFMINEYRSVVIGRPIDALNVANCSNVCLMKALLKASQLSHEDCKQTTLRMYLAPKASIPNCSYVLVALISIIAGRSQELEWRSTLSCPSKEDYHVVLKKSKESRHAPL